MRVRKVTTAGPGGSGGGDMRFGSGQADYWNNDAHGVGQLVSSRLRLWLGDWFLNPTDGTPYLTEVLGRYTEETRDATIRGRIYATTGVTEINDYNSQLNRQSRDFTVNATIATAYGAFVLQGAA